MLNEKKQREQVLCEMCRHIFMWHMMCNHFSINEERCDQALSPFSTPLFCDKYQVEELSTHTARCRGLYCKNDSRGMWSERDGPRVAQLSLDVQHLKDLIGARELECQFVIQRWYRGGPLQQTREEEHYVRLQEELTELRLKKYKLRLSITALEDFYNPAKSNKGFDRALYLAEFLEKKNRLIAASRKNASIPLPTQGIPRFTPFVKMPFTSDNSTLLIPRLNSNHGTLPGYAAAIEPPDESGIFASGPSHHISLNDVAANESSNDANVSPGCSTAEILVAEERMDTTPQSSTNRLCASPNVSQPGPAEAASNSRSRLRCTVSKRRSARQTSVEDIASSGTRRSGRLSGKGRKNYAESSSDETSLSPTQTILRQPASQKSRGTSLINGSKRRKMAEALDDDFDEDDEGKFFDLDPQDDEECRVSEPSPSNRPSSYIGGWRSPSVLLEDLPGGYETGGVISLPAAQKPSGLLSNPRVLDALQKLRAQTNTAQMESSQSQKYGIAPMAPMYTPPSTILSGAAPALDIVSHPPLSSAMSRGASYVPHGSPTNLQQAVQLPPRIALSHREDDPVESGGITASPRSIFPLVDAQLPTSTFYTASQYHDKHGILTIKDNGHHVGRMTGIEIQQPAEQSGTLDLPGANVDEFNGGSFEDINFDDMINFGGDEV